MDIKETIARSEALGRDSRRAGISFLKTEVETGLAFAKVARDAENGSAKRTRNQANARKAYDTIVKWHLHFFASDAERMDMREFEPGFTELRSALQELGEDVN